MAIVPLPLPPSAEARALLHHLLQHGDVVGRDTAGRTIIQLAVDDRVLDKLMVFDAETADLEDGGDDEPDADDEEDCTGPGRAGAAENGEANAGHGIGLP